MRSIWWALKLAAGLVIVGCLLAAALVVLAPEMARHYALAWAATMLVSVVAYGYSHARLNRLTRRPARRSWQGKMYVLPAPLIRQITLCVCFAGLGLVLPLAWIYQSGGLPPGWEGFGLLLGTLLALWLCRASVLGLQHMRRAGHALKLDAAGVHYPGLPLLPWPLVAGVDLKPLQSGTDRSQCLVLQMRILPDQPSGLLALWHSSLPGASIRGNSISLPLPTLREPAALLAAAQALWRQHAVSHRG